MARVTHFEINADDPERASSFYREVFDWGIVKWDGPVDYWLITTGAEDEPGIHGALMRRSDPGAGTWITVEVDSVDDHVTRALAAGGEVVLPKMTVPGVGYQAYCRDTEGNILGIHQSDPAAGQPRGAGGTG